MYPIKIIFIFCLLIASDTDAFSQRLEKFVSRERSHERNGAIVPVAYPDIANYFGYLAPDTSSRSAQAEPAKTYLYFWLRENVSELGIRVISPVPELVFPDKGDIASESYMINEKDKADSFSPSFKLYKAKGISPATTYNAKPGEIEWSFIAENDKQKDEPWTQVNKKNYTLVRLQDQSTDASKTDRSGFYKLVIFTTDTLSSTGSFLVQVGSTSDIKSIKIAEKPEGM